MISTREDPMGSEKFRKVPKVAEEVSTFEKTRKDPRIAERVNRRSTVNSNNTKNYLKL